MFCDAIPYYWHADACRPFKYLISVKRYTLDHHILQQTPRIDQYFIGLSIVQFSQTLSQWADDGPHPFLSILCTTNVKVVLDLTLQMVPLINNATS